MVGYSQMREALIWVQIDKEADVQLKYWPQLKEQEAHLSQVQQATYANAFIVKLIADSVEPGIHYDYAIVIDGKTQSFDYPLTFQTQPLWQYRTDPPAFRMALGSCAYINETQYDRPGEPYGGDYQIFNSMYQSHPDFMVWLGDNIYLREADWFSRTGMIRRYNEMRGLPELQPFWANTHHYAIWDDHDFGPNDAVGSFPFKNLTRELFNLYWGNPEIAQNELGAVSYFQWHDMDYFLLDNRWNRTAIDRKTGKKQMLGDAQIEWLIDALKTSRAPFKFVAVGSQVLNTAKRFENMAQYEEERELLISRIVEEGIKGVVFITGDRHHTELSQYEENGIVIYDLTVSPLTSHAVGDYSKNEGNTLRVEGTYYGERNYGIIDFSGARKSREMHIQIFNSDGEPVWDKTIKAQ